MLPLLETCQIRLQDVSLWFSKALKLYGALRDCKPNMMESEEVKLPHRAGHRGCRTCLLVAGGHQPNLCYVWKVQKYILHRQASTGCQLKASGEGSRPLDVKSRTGWFGLLPPTDVLTHMKLCPGRTRILKTSLFGVLVTQQGTHQNSSFV